MAKIAILDDLLGQAITVVLTDGSELTAKLDGVSHQDDWDVLILAGREPLRSSAVSKIYAATAAGPALVWPEGAVDDTEDREAARAVLAAGFSEEIYQQAIKLLDRPVTVTLGDDDTLVGQLEAVTPPGQEEPATLHISSLEELGVPIRIVQLSAVTEIELFALTHAETEDIIVEEGAAAQAEPATEVVSAVDEQRAQAEEAAAAPAHKEADVLAAFGLAEEVAGTDPTPDPDLQEDNVGVPNPPPEDADNSETAHTHGDFEHDHEEGEEPHAHDAPATPESEADPNRPTEVENDLPGEEHPEGWDPPAAPLEDDGSQEDTSGSENVDDPDAD